MAKSNKEIEKRLADIEYYTLDLTPEEVKAGWHFCPEWDYLVITPDSPEFDACICSGLDEFRS